ncbi:multi-sensor signal transduction histidine kinase [Calothrix sp. NIES-4071]|nr:multi-sensor signal transduction histidine kinase [Calothrix sp. NIES-4071]BAZ62891.1 multi-sensor signal transduction histidine kinase [Calothrix sp. NIES-4105]
MLGDLENIVITSELQSRTPRETNLHAENQALALLTRLLVNKPETMLQNLVEIALELCQAGTAGVSTFSTTFSGKEVFRWNVLAGTLKQHTGATIPRSESLCSMCLNHGTPKLYQYPERYFTYLQAVKTPIVEALVLPVVADSQTLGTIWIMSHSQQRHFDSEDVRVMTCLADFTAAALSKQRQTQSVIAPINERRRVEESDLESKSYFRTFVNLVPDMLWRNNVTGDTSWYNQRWLDYTGQTLEEAQGYGWLDVIHPEDYAQSASNFQNAVHMRCPLRQEHRIRGKDGFYRWFLVQAMPVCDYSGRIIEWFGAATDIHEQRAAIEALQQSEQRLRVMIENLPGGAAFVVDRNLRYLLAEGEALYTAGFKPEDLVGKTIFDALTPELATQYEKIYRLALAGESFTYEHNAHGSSYISHGTPLIDSSGFIYAVLAVSYDISDRKKAEVALRESEEKYRTLFNSIDQGFGVAEVIFNSSDEPIDFRFLEVNEQFEHQTGLKRTSVLSGRTIRQVAPNVEEEFFQIYGQVARTGEPIRFEQYSPLLNRWFSVYAFSFSEPQRRRIAVLFNNITERKQADEQLRRAALMDAFRVKLSDALRPLTDPVQIQAQACRLLGEHLNVDRAYYVEIDSAEDVARVNQDYLRGNSPSLVGVYRFADYGWIVPFLQKGETIRVTDTQKSNIIPTANDRSAMAAIRIGAHISVPLIKAFALVGALCVTESAPREWLAQEVELVRETAERIWATIERARAEAALRESEIQRIQEQAAREEERQRAESLAELDRAKTIFFSNISHEFRTPLTLLLAPLQDALHDNNNPLSPQMRERLEVAHRNAIRLLKLVNTLLDFSRIEAGRMKAVYQETDLAQLTTELASVFRSAIEQAGLRFIVDCPPLRESVYVDREMWEKIVLNLLSNAFKFTLKGEITVRLLQLNDQEVTLQVQDTGVGIENKEMPRLFERFYQVRGTQARTHEGSGIGLALVHELVKLHGGKINVSSTLGERSCFSVTIPLGKAHLPSIHISSHSAELKVLSAEYSIHSELSTHHSSLPNTHSELSTHHSSLPNTHSELSTQHSSLLKRHSSLVLLVDDNADMRDYLTRILREHVTVEAVGNGATALAAATAHVPDLILSDVMMPGLDGFELLKALRNNPRTKEVPIILLSARAREESVIEGLQTGADDYLIKPFSASLLIARVNAHLQMAQLRSEALRHEKASNRMKDKLLAEVSHELNAPLVAILGWTRLLRSSPFSPAMLTKSLETIERNATLQAKLVQDLLDLSRITSGKINLNKAPVELQSVVDTAIATVRPKLESKDICLESILDPKSITIEGDFDRLQQIVLNLLTNAIKFTPTGGRIVVYLGANKTQAQLLVNDNGIGIDAEFLPHIYDTFRTSQNSKGGLGLGLAIVRHLVQLHGGAISAESLGIGQGATFSVKLPLINVIPI